MFPDGVVALGGVLAVLDAYINCFVGPLPRGLGELRRLQRLNLGGSFFNGSVPAEIGQLRSLRFLHLAGNALTRRLPSELGALASLEQLEIGYNAYDGGVPAELGNLTESFWSSPAGSEEEKEGGAAEFTGEGGAVGFALAMLAAGAREASPRGSRRG